MDSIDIKTTSTDKPLERGSTSIVYRTNKDGSEKVETVKTNSVSSLFGALRGLAKQQTAERENSSK